MQRVLLRVVADAFFIATLLFAGAETVAWSRAWTLLVVLLVVRILTVLAVYPLHPALLQERARLPIHRDQRRTDKLLVAAVLTTGFVALPVIAAVDVFHWHAFPRPAPFIADLGLVLFVLGWSIQAFALRANPFATTTVRLQQERQHAIVDSGVYALVRHPFYMGTPLVLVGMSLWLESYVAALLALVPITITVMRIGHEERFLRRELPAYNDYAARVHYRLLPGIW